MWTYCMSVCTTHVLKSTVKYLAKDCVYYQCYTTFHQSTSRLGLQKLSRFMVNFTSFSTDKQSCDAVLVRLLSPCDRLSIRHSQSSKRLDG